MFSVVIPLYNKAHTINSTLRSVLFQTYTQFEIVIVNDGSTDNWREVVSQLRDDRIRIIDQKNSGVSAARNTGVLFSNHHYIAFLDGDDEWKPNYLSTIKEAIERFPNAGMFCSAGIVRNPDGKEKYRIAKKYRGEIRKIDFFENPHVFLHTSATVVSKDVFNQTSGFPLGMTRNEDYALFFSLALITQVIYCGYPLSYYIGGVSGQATNTPQNKVINHIVNRFNMVYANWISTDAKNQTFIIFLKYELRDIFAACIKTREFQLLYFLLNNLENSILKLFPEFEILLYKRKRLRHFAFFYILITKTRWRLRGYPRVNFGMGNKSTFSYKVFHQLQRL